MLNILKKLVPYYVLLFFIILKSPNLKRQPIYLEDDLNLQKKLSYIKKSSL